MRSKKRSEIQFGSNIYQVGDNTNLE